MSQVISTTSPSSTNSSYHEYSGTDRSMLDDEEYGNLYFLLKQKHLVPRINFKLTKFDFVELNRRDI